MDPVTEITEEQTPRGAWTVTTLLFLYMLVNFADKAVVGLAAVPIMRELDLSPKQFGLVGSSFSFLPKSAMGFWTKQPLGRNGISSPFGEARLRRSSPAACSEGYFCRRRWDFRRF
jgi:hypothetical protein